MEEAEQGKQASVILGARAFFDILQPPSCLEVVRILRALPPPLDPQERKQSFSNFPYPPTCIYIYIYSFESTCRIVAVKNESLAPHEILKR